MQKIIKLVTNEYLPKELPHGGILMNDGEDIDFTNFAVEPEPCPECPECPESTNKYGYILNDSAAILCLNDDDGNRWTSDFSDTLFWVSKGSYIYDTNGQEYTSDIKLAYINKYDENYFCSFFHSLPDDTNFSIIAVDKNILDVAEGISYFDTLEEAQEEYNSGDYNDWAHTWIPG